MEERHYSRLEYYFRSIKWLIGNLLFGLFPLGLMCSIYVASEGKVGGQQIEGQIYEGAILFVCLALVGSVLLDTYLSGRRFSGMYRFFVYAVPASIVGIVTLNYLLIKFKVIHADRFAVSSYTTITVFVISSFYIIFVKANLQMKEDLNHELPI